MSPRPPLGRLLLVTDRLAADARGRPLAELLAGALAAIPPGAAVVQLREKDLGARDLLALAGRLVPVARARGCPLLINDRLDVALAAGADGVHLPETGLPVAAARRLAPEGFLVGASTHGPDAAVAAARQGADLVVCGPIWDTPSKHGLIAPIGLEALAAAARGAHGARLYAIGGVTAARARACRDAGAHGAAVIRAWLDGAAAELAAALDDPAR